MIVSIRSGIAVLACLSVSACGLPGGMFTPATANMSMPDGPPIEDIVTPFDDALTCLRGSLPRGLVFAVGQVVDSTGRESYADGNAGRFVSQGAGEMVQSALFRAGVSLVNRRDAQITALEAQWGIRDIQMQMPVNFFVSGSINSLDFIPGGGFSATVSGVGPRYRQNRMLVGLDLTMTDAFTGQIVASVPLQRQIFSREFGAGIGTFFGDTLVNVDAGGQEREALNFVLRQMMSLATFELLGQVAEPERYEYCRGRISRFYGDIGDSQFGDPQAFQAAMSIANEVAERRRTTLGGQAGAPQAAGASQAAAAGTVENQIRELAHHASVFAARAIAAAEESLSATSLETAAVKAAEAVELMRGAAQILERAAQLGLSGPEGDAVAVVVERAIELTQQAAAAVSARASEGAATAAPAATPEPAPSAAPAPADPAPILEAPAQGPAPVPGATPLPSPRHDAGSGAGVLPAPEALPAAPPATVPAAAPVTDAEAQPLHDDGYYPLPDTVARLAVLRSATAFAPALRGPLTGDVARTTGPDEALQ